MRAIFTSAGGKVFETRFRNLLENVTGILGVVATFINRCLFDFWLHVDPLINYSFALFKTVRPKSYKNPV